MSKVVYLLEDENTLRSTLKEYLKIQNYRVLAYSDPSFCPLKDNISCTCSATRPCADYIITDINMPSMSGLKFIELQRAKFCKAPHIAVMSATWTEEEYQKARDMGCKVFDKPFELKDLMDWMKQCEEIPQSSACNVEPLKL